MDPGNLYLLAKPLGIKVNLDFIEFTLTLLLCKKIKKG